MGASQVPRWYAETDNYPYHLQYADGNIEVQGADYFNWHKQVHKKFFQAVNTYNEQHGSLGREKRRWWGAGNYFYPEWFSMFIRADNYWGDNWFQKHWEGLVLTVYACQCTNDDAYGAKEVAGTEYNYLLRETISAMEVSPVRTGILGTGWYLQMVFNIGGVRVKPDETIIIHLRNNTSDRLANSYFWLIGSVAEH